MSSASALQSAAPFMERWHLTLRTPRPIGNVQHAGSMLRGALGHALRELACHCGNPHHAPDCLYQRIFEPVAPDEVAGRQTDIPPAFVISPPLPAEQHHNPSFGFTLLGPALEHASSLWAAWKWATQARPGNHLVGELERQSLGATPAPVRIPTGQPLRLQFTSPLLLKRKLPGETCSRAIEPHALGMRDLLIALHRRLSTTHRLYGVPTQPPAPLGAWLDACEHCRLETRLEAVDYGRRSSRQNRFMPLHGLLGRMELHGALPPDLLDAFSLGQWLNLGNKTSLGQGAYRLLAPSAPTLRITQEIPTDVIRLPV